ncbi:Alpha/beta hydrolase fold-1 [Mycena rebaudengoi]|nr:Alpha/beta hydrolase fold-1 [Mycena rebaudengoi]
MSLLRERIDLVPSSSYPFHVLATKYDYVGNPHADSEDALTLIFTHALGVHKETWETTVAHIFSLCSSGLSRVKIRDVFSIESPNHGESSMINADEIAKQAVTNWPREYANATQRFLTVGALEGARIDFMKRKLIGISHSIGAVALFLTAQANPTIPFKAMITFEPGITDEDNEQRNLANVAVTAWVWLRPDVWRSRKVAKKELAASPMYATWDPSVFDLFMEHAIIPHPASRRARPFKFPGVITCPVEGPSRCKTVSVDLTYFFRNSRISKRSFMSEDLVKQGVVAYATVTQRLPVHVVWGAVDEFANDELRNFMSNTKVGRTPVSISHIDDAGHMVVQQQPARCAEVIVSLLTTSTRTSRL